MRELKSSSEVGVVLLRWAGCFQPSASAMIHSSTRCCSLVKGSCFLCDEVILVVTLPRDDGSSSLLSSASKGSVVEALLPVM